MCTIVIQLGAILALPVYFCNRILKFLSTFPKGESGTPQRFSLIRSGSYIDRVRYHGGAVVSFEKTDRTEPGESLGNGVGAVHRRRRHVARGRELCRNPRTSARWKKCRCPQARLDRFRADCIGGLSGTSRSMSTIAAGQLVGLEPERSARVLVFFFHADDGGRDRLRSAQDVAAWQR